MKYSDEPISTNSKQRTVLLVDDEPMVRDGLTRLLRRESLRIFTADCAESALKIIEVAHVDVIVCDEFMPGMTGTELLSILTKKRPRIQKILLSGKLNIETAKKAINEGKIFRCFSKPAVGDQIVSSIREALKIGRQDCTQDYGAESAAITYYLVENELSLEQALAEALTQD